MSTVVAGSLAAFAASSFAPGTGADVVVLTTASAFRGAAEAALEVAVALDADASVEALMALDRASSGDAHFVERIEQADLVVLTDGSPLHAVAVWHHSAVGAALRDARLVAIGSVATVLGDVMIDPRGGAPTIGLGYRHGVVLSTPSSSEQAARTRSLLTGDDPLVVVGPRGVVVEDHGRWRVAAGEDDVTVSVGDGPASLD